MFAKKCLDFLAVVFVLEFHSAMGEVLCKHSPAFWTTDVMRNTLYRSVRMTIQAEEGKLRRNRAGMQADMLVKVVIVALVVTLALFGAACLHRDPG